MQVVVAQRLARRIHDGHRTRAGEPLIEHLDRVARAVPGGLRGLAYLHDVIERDHDALLDLRDAGLSAGELAVLVLLSRAPDESYEEYVLRIAWAGGATGRAARVIKRADLHDHLRHQRTAGAPDYCWAYEQIFRAQVRNAERPGGLRGRRSREASPRRA